MDGRGQLPREPEHVGREEERRPLAGAEEGRQRRRGDPPARPEVEHRLEQEHIEKRTNVEQVLVFSTHPLLIVPKTMKLHWARRCAA